MTNLHSILKSRDITLPTTVCLVKSMVFPVVMYGCESWTIKKAEHWRTDAFELWCWRRLLRVPLTARRSNQSNLKEISPVCSLEGLILKLKLEYFGYLMRRTESLEKTLMLAGIEGRRRRGRMEDEMVGWHHWLNGHGFGWTLGVGNGQGGLVNCGSWGCKMSDTTEWLNWTELKLRKKCLSKSCHHRPANGAGCLFLVWHINNLVHRGSKSSFGVGLSLVGNSQQILKKSEQLWEVINRAL